MRSDLDAALDRAENPRVIGAAGPLGGALLVVVAGLHGNEPAGILACQRVLVAIASMPLRGRFVALRGNVAGLALGRRFVDVDLNRHWTPDRVRGLRAGARPASVEDAELLALDHALDDAAAHAEGARFLVDLHTTSAASVPFLLVGRRPAHLALARGMGVPLVLGLEAQLQGTMLARFAAEGWIGFGVEGGRHDDPESAERLEAVVWLALVNAGLLAAVDVPRLDGIRQRLTNACSGLPGAVEVQYRHAIRPSDAFRMRDGFVNFQPVVSGQTVASDWRGPVRAPETGRILMPLYQAQGDDGFFLVRPVPRAALDADAAAAGARCA